VEIIVNLNSVALTVENFESVILEQSKQQLILAVFWAEQIPESIALKAKLSAYLAPYGDHISIATVDCETEQQIAMQFGIQGLPTAILVKDAQPIDGVSGPQSDESIAAFLEKHLPKPQDELLQQAQQALQQGDSKSAFTFAQQAQKLDAQRADIQLVLADSCLQLGKTAEAEDLLSGIKMIDQDSYYQALKAKLELVKEAADSPEIKALEQQLAQNPDDIAAIHQLSAQYSQVNRLADALELLFTQMKKDGSDATSKQLLLDILKTLPNGDPLAAQYRRKLFSLLY
jgi:putative thioredoxin